MSVHSAYRYVETRKAIVEEMERSASQAVKGLQKNISGLMAAYAVSEYDNIISNEITRHNYFSIIVEDYNTGKILGERAFVSGKIRNTDWQLIEYNNAEKQHNITLTNCCYSQAGDVVSPMGEVIGKVTIYLSNQHLNEELNAIIVGTIFDALIISILLIASLLFTIRHFILKPVSTIVKELRQSDEDGLPVHKIAAGGSDEINILSATMNKMIQSIRKSRIRLKQQHEEILAREDELRTLSMATEQSPVSVIICDPNFVIEYANPQFEKTSGFKITEITGRSIDYIFESNPVNRQPVNELKQKLGQGEPWIGELTPLTENNQVYCIRLSASGIKSDESGMTHMVFVAEDITEQKRNEEMLRNSQKMEAVGQLTGGVAHDFNNLLGIIMGNLELMEMSLQDQPKQLERIRQALASTQRGAQLTRKLLNFSRREGVVKKLTQTNSVIENLVDLIAKSVTASVKLETQLENNLWLTSIDAGDLEDAILNLCLNARDAMPDGGTLSIETANRLLDSDYIELHPDAMAGEFVEIKISDTGTGMSGEAIKRIFDPFYSTKPFGKGTGLGLSMVYGFVQRSGGYIQIESEPGVGSQFHIFLPKAVGEEKIEQSGDSIELLRGSETILIVDDELALLTSAQSHLQELGYATLTASDAEEAIEVLSAHPEIDLVFSDVVMPGLNGFELSVMILKNNPGMKILLASGFTSEQINMQGESEKIYQVLANDLLKKPYSIIELATAVRLTLDQQQTLAVG